MEDETLALPEGPGPEGAARIAHYRLLRKLGEGGMGVVYAGIDERLDRPVAIKLVRQDKLDAISRTQLEREARMAAAVNHPAICQLYDIGESGGQFYLAMEYLEGRLLSEIVRAGPLPVGEAAALILELLGGLGYMHAKGLVHRDLKPGNLIRTEHGLKILDFGLARRIGGANDQTLTAGSAAGTPAYMAPEAVHGETAGPRADLFAVGAIFYELISGKKAFSGATVLAVLQAVVNEHPPALGGSAAAAAADRVIRRALAKKAADRFASAEDFAEAVRAMLSGNTAASGAATPARAITRLIVLPFRVLRKDEDTEFLAVSLPDAVTATISGLGSVMVRSSAVAARYSGDNPDLARLAAEAGVDVALTGTLLRAGSQVRVNTQLVEVPGGTLVRAHQAQASLADLFQVQDDLVRSIVNSLQLELTPGEDRQLRAAAPAAGTAYELFLRANAAGSGFLRLAEARDLYLECLAQDPGYAPAWARLGRCYRLLAKYNEDPQANLRRAEETFQKALQIQPELDLTHSLYAQLEADLGRSRAALERLLARAARHPNSPDLFAGLVYACRFCGLTAESIWFHEEARRLDPLFPSSVTHTYFQCGDYRRSLESYSGDVGYIDAASLEASGQRTEALRRTADRLAADSTGAVRLAPLARLYIASLHALLEGRTAESNAMVADAFDRFFLGPEETLYFARQLIRAGEVEAGSQRALATVEKGWGGAAWLRQDPWFHAAKANVAFQRAAAVAEAYREQALVSLERYRSALGA